MKLYVCYGTFQPKPRLRPGGHPCANAFEALRKAGHDPEVVKAYGFGPLPDFLNTPRRREVKKLSGSSWVPALVTDEGDVISDSKNIVAWAAEHPARDLSP